MTPPTKRAAALGEGRRPIEDYAVVRRELQRGGRILEQYRAEDGRSLVTVFESSFGIVETTTVWQPVVVAYVDHLGYLRCVDCASDGDPIMGGANHADEMCDGCGRPVSVLAQASSSSVRMAA